MAEVIRASHDSHIRNRLDKNTNYGDEILLRIGREPLLQRNHGLLRFDLSPHVGWLAVSATLSLYVTTASASARPGWVYRVTTAWEEMFATWNDAGEFTQWGKAGGDYTAVDGVDWDFPTATGWADIEIISLARDALENRSGDLSIIVMPTGAVTVGWFEADSHDHPTESARPKVTLGLGVGPPYSVQAGEIFEAGATAGEIHAPGGSAGEVHAPGAIAGDAYIAGAAFGEGFGAGATPGQIHVPRAAVGGIFGGGAPASAVFQAGSVASETLSPGARAGKIHAAGAVAGEVYAAGAVAAEDG